MTTLFCLLAIALILFLVCWGTPPTPNTTRVQPTGFKMQDGQFAKIVLGTGSTYNAIWFWEHTIMPPGWSGGDKIPTTTMLNLAYRTYAPRHLKELTDCTGTAAYDPNVINTNSAGAGANIANLINLNQSITVIWPDGYYVCFWGYLKEFKFKELKEGEMPEADYTIVVTNTDQAGLEAGPVAGGGPGT